MNTEQVKDVLTAIGYPVEGDDLIAVLDDLHDTYSPQVVGSSVRTLGDAEPLYVKAGQVAFLVDNEQDLVTACVRIRSILKKREADKPVRIEGPKRSRWLNEITRAIEFEIDISEKVKRPLGIVADEYAVKFDPETRTQSRKADQIVEDLLASDAKRNQKAVKAIQTIMIYKR